MRYLLLAGLLAGIPTTSLGWGGKGHRLIASLAEERLKATNRTAMSQVIALLGPGVSLASIAICADSIRDYVSARDKATVVFPVGCIISKEEAVALFPSTGSWHYVNIPVPASVKPSDHPAMVLTEACAERPPCILTQIDHFTAQLSNRSLDRKTRAIALMFLVHLVGDLHQPLHAVSRQNDRGGNEVWVTLGDRSGRLHSVWDSMLVDPLQDADVIAARGSRKGNARSWAWESYDVAREVAYAGVPVQVSSEQNPIVLPHPAYRDAATRVVKQRLRAASLRLADLLAKSLGG